MFESCVRRAAMAILVLGSMACQTAAAIGASCQLRSDCVEPLLCAGGVCRAECAAAIDCPMGWTCGPSGTAHTLACLPPSSPVLCAYNSECPSGSFCVDQQCRAQCVSARDCPSGTACSASGTCVMPVVTPATPDAGLDVDAAGCTTCGQRCVDLSSDSAHCGACDHACPAGDACTAGQCVAGGACDPDGGLCCASGQLPCGGACIDPTSDPSDCGACGVVCPSGVCRQSNCIPANDECSGATPIDVSSGSGSAPGHFVLGELPSTGSCDGTADLYFSFQLAQRSLVFGTWATTSASPLAGLRATCDSAVIGCTTECMPGFAFAAFDPGTHYLALSGLSPGVDGAFDGTANVYVLPLTNDVADRILIGDGATTQTFTGSTTSAMNTPGTSGAGPDALYWFETCTTFVGGVLMADTCAAASFDTALEIVTTDGQAGASASTTTCGTGGVQIAWMIPPGPGLYALFVDGRTASDSGTYTLTVQPPS